VTGVAFVIDPLDTLDPLARLIHAYGMLSAPTLAAGSPVRMSGAIGTYVFGVALAIAALVSLP
jgi:uncharacterized membrane protein YecN with MAPEG domain